MGDPQVNKFEQVSSLEHQMSLAGGLGLGLGGGWSQCLEGARLGPGQEGLLLMRSNASWVMITWDPLPVDGQTHVGENITFPQLHWQEVKIRT